MDETAPSEWEMGPLPAVSPGTGAERVHSAKEWVRVCFSCGRQGHGVNRCSQVNTSFPFLPPGWSVDVRNGQYRATQTDGTRLGSIPEMRDGLGGRVSFPDHRDEGTTDPSRGVGGSRRRQPAWQLPVGRGVGPHWASNTIGEPFHEGSWTE